jgi:hypothetical protein
MHRPRPRRARRGIAAGSGITERRGYGIVTDLTEG